MQKASFLNTISETGDLWRSYGMYSFLIFFKELIILKIFKEKNVHVGDATITDQYFQVMS
jgi:hypothetical protein